MKHLARVDQKARGQDLIGKLRYEHPLLVNKERQERLEVLLTAVRRRWALTPPKWPDLQETQDDLWKRYRI